MGANLWLGYQKDRHLRFACRPLNLVPAPCADKMSTILLGLHLPLFLSLAQIRDRRPLRYGERQSGYHCVSFANYSQFTDSVLLHMRVILHRRDITVSRNSLAWIFCTTPTNCTRYTVGCDDSAHRLYPTCTIYPVGAAIGHPHNGKPSRQFSIFHYQFSITANR